MSSQSSVPANALPVLQWYEHEPSGTEVARLVLKRAPEFRPVAELVRAVCAYPWGIRRPVDLARLLGLERDDVVQACHALGFARGEHFITAVRMVALAALTAERRLTISAARLLVGVSDTSNARRQLRRVGRRSGRALRQLAGLAKTA